MLRLNDKYLVDGTGAEHRRAQLHSAPLAHALVRNFNVYQRTMRAEMRRVRRRMTVLWRNIKPVKVSSLGVFGAQSQLLQIYQRFGFVRRCVCGRRWWWFCIDYTRY